MWARFARIILRNRITFITVILLLTAVFGYFGSRLQLSYELARVLPLSDKTLQDYLSFKKQFGEDGNVMVIGMKDEDLFRLKQFNAWKDLGLRIKKVDGIRDVISIASIYNVHRDDEKGKLELYPVFDKEIESQTELDSLKSIVSSLPFYDGLLYNSETHATVMAVSFNADKLNSAGRIVAVEEIQNLCKAFSDISGIELFLSGLPYIRTEYMKMVSSEMELFMILAVIVTALILFVFFRSFSSVFFSLLVVIIGVVWSVGIMQMLGYQISVLSGIIPPLIVIISVPNCIFLINKYHSEYAVHRNKARSLTRMIEKNGLTLLLANITTAIGFGVFYFTGSIMLVEFGIVASVSVMATYFICLILVPSIYSFLPSPSMRKTEHLSAPRINRVLSFIDFIVHHHRGKIYIAVSIATLIGLIGMMMIRVEGFVVDDLPSRHKIYSDLRFFEKNFNGIMPFEIVVDTKEEGGVFSNNARAIYKINALQKKLVGFQELSRPVSVAEGVKFLYQGFRDGSKKYYILPGSTELKKLSDYIPEKSSDKSFLTSFIDSTEQVTRLSYQAADIGSVRMKELSAKIRQHADSIFDPAQYDVTLTGHSLVFLKNNDYLLSNLFESLIIEIILITLMGMLLFRSVRIIILSKLPCLIPLVITAGIMGFAGINFKASTILIFTIAFGIASDGTIYFLSKYRYELKKHPSPSKAISITIKETGLNMIYSSMILFCGFGIFAASQFGGTQAMGLLVSITLLISMCTNLILLPAILLSVEKYISRKEMIAAPILETEEEEEEVAK